MEEEGIIKKVTEPTLWVSSMVVVKKKTGQLRICLDPRDLNENIIRENYPLPTIESIATRLSEAKVFSVLDVRHGFWHMVLDEKSSFLTTFNTPFGRYRWLRMPFGICSAPEIFQRKIHEIIEGMEGIEVVADDFLIYGCGKTTELANEDHDRKFRAFLKKCKINNLHLNKDKMIYKNTEVSYLGHRLSSEGIKPCEEKIKAIQ